MVKSKISLVYFISRGKVIKEIQIFIRFLLTEFPAFLAFLHFYFKNKLWIFSGVFERNKDLLVRNILIKRGRTNRLFLHLCAMSVLVLGVLVSPYLSESNPFSQTNSASFAQSSSGESLVSDDVFHTQESDKPRDRIVTYTVQKGDTISLIAKRFDISEDTVRWANDLRNDNIVVEDELKILPVSGVSHKVARGDNVYTIAKKYDVNPQEIVDFPFNDFANPQTFALVEGQILVVPNGVKPQERIVPIRPRYIATGPIVPAVPGASGFTWPLQGIISQYYAWYHKGIDITSPVGSPIVAAQSGKVIEVHTSGWHGGYGIHLVIQGDNGQSSLYAHMSGVNVSVGDTVSAGSTVIGWVGLTGRTTGSHLHFEIKSSNGFLNPISALR